MLNINIYSFAKNKQQFIADGEAEYLKRLRPYSKLKLTELSVKGRQDTPENIKALEARTLLDKCGSTDFLIALDEKGKSFTSEQFADFLQSKMNTGISSFSFAIGGPYGWNSAVTQRANLTMSLSNMTYTAQMSRLILIEQFYRAVTLLNNIPYHKA